MVTFYKYPRSIIIRARKPKCSSRGRTEEYVHREKRTTSAYIHGEGKKGADEMKEISS